MITMDRVRDTIKRAYEIDVSTVNDEPVKRIVVGDEDIDKAKRIDDFNKGIINFGRM